MSAWFTVRETQLVWAPVGKYLTKKGEERTKFLRIGVRVTMMDGSWWFHSFKHKSWTKHWPPVRVTDMLGRPAFNPDRTPAFHPERTDRYTEPALQKEWGGRRPELVSALQKALWEAESDEEGL